LTANWLLHYEGRRVRPTDDIAAACVVDPLRGDFYITGYRWLPLRGEEWLTIKSNSAGQILWAVSNDGENQGDDRPTAICLDAAGNVYVGGWCWSDSSRDYLTIKYNADGVKLWQRRYTLAGKKSAERIATLAVDDNANVHVTGSGGEQMVALTSSPSSMILMATSCGWPVTTGRPIAMKQPRPCSSMRRVMFAWAATPRTAPGAWIISFSNTTRRVSCCGRHGTTVPAITTTSCVS